MWKCGSVANSNVASSNFSLQSFSSPLSHLRRGCATGTLGDRPRDCASNLHNIRLTSKNNATFQDGRFGDKTLVFGARGAGLGLRVCDNCPPSCLYSLLQCKPVFSPSLFEGKVSRPLGHRGCLSRARNDNCRLQRTLAYSQNLWNNARPGRSTPPIHGN